LTVALDTAQTFLLLLLRVGTFILLVPPFGETQVPPRIRVGLAIVLSATLMWAAPASHLGELTLSGMFQAGLRETLLGLAGGLGTSLVFQAAGAAGFLAGTSMGLGFGAAAAAGVDGAAIAQFLHVLALGALVGLGAHRQAIVWLYESVRAFPPGGLPGESGVGPAEIARLASTCINYGLFSIALAIRVVFPVLATALLGHAAMGIVSRAAPQINLQSVGFSISILSGGTALYFAAPLMAQAVAQATLASLGH
jgi:flagellar biosynthetic protein FliR